MLCRWAPSLLCLLSLLGVPWPSCLQDTGIAEGTGQLSSGTVLVCVIVHSQNNPQITLGTDKIGGGSAV